MFKYPIDKNKVRFLHFYKFSRIVQTVTRMNNKSYFNYRQYIHITISNRCDKLSLTILLLSYLLDSVQESDTPTIEEAALLGTSCSLFFNWFSPIQSFGPVCVKVISLDRFTPQSGEVNFQLETVCTIQVFNKDAGWPLGFVKLSTIIF